MWQRVAHAITLPSASGLAAMAAATSAAAAWRPSPTALLRSSSVSSPRPTARVGRKQAERWAPAAPTATTSTTQLVQQSLCPSEQGAGIVANFGHRRTTGAADKLRAHAQTFGFRGLVIQLRSCHNYAVVLPGLKNLRQAKDLQREARRVSLHVTIDCRSHPFQGGLAAVFGHRPTRRAALRLLREARRVGFQNLQVQQDRCNDWEVDLYGIKTPVQRQELTKEAASVGFHLTFEPG